MELLRKAQAKAKKVVGKAIWYVDLGDARRVTARRMSSDGRPTLDIRDPCIKGKRKRSTEIRYNP